MEIASNQRFVELRDDNEPNSTETTHQPHRLRIESLGLCGILTFIIIFLALIAGSVVLVIYGPEQLIGDGNVISCPANLFGEWRCSVSIHGVNRWNRWIALYAHPYSLKFDEMGIEKDVNFTIDVYGSKTANDSLGLVSLVSGLEKTRTIICRYRQEQCNTILLLQQNFIDQADYEIQIVIKDTSFQGIAFLDRCDLEFVYVNTDYTFFELIGRYGFLILTIMFVLISQCAMIRCSRRDIIPEQRWVALLGVSLIAFDNPFFICELLLDMWIFPLITTLFTVSFIGALLLVWLLIVDSVMEDESKRSFWSFYFPKIVLVTTIWALLVSLFVWDTFNQISDPAYGAQHDFPWYKYLFALVVSLVALYLVWIAYLAVRITGELKHVSTNMPVGFKFLSILTLFVFIATASGIFLNAIGPLADSPAKFLGFFALLNCYVYVLLILFMPVGR
mmetsp:Transcript_46281/g.75526  ORF Transcript_46281/g.75526 Transcript_46281/m.75526 type:complete len:448 (-) Transcript_46281:363-1706(-)